MELPHGPAGLFLTEGPFHQRCPATLGTKLATTPREITDGNSCGERVGADRRMASKFADFLVADRDISRR